MQKFDIRELISRNYIMWKLNSIIRIKCETYLKLWKTYMIMQTSIDLEKELEKYQYSAEESCCCHKLNKYKQLIDKE